MRSLPQLVPSAGEGRLVMADRSAALLAELLLAANGAEAAEALSEQLAEDPPLVVWTVCRAGTLEPDWRPASVASVARWLARRLIEALAWDPAARQSGPELGKMDADPFAAQVADDLAQADLAALLVESAGLAAVDEAFLLGLLAGADRWLTAGDRSPEAASPPLPRWLSEATGSPAQRAVDRAARILAGEEPPPPDLDLGECRNRAAEAAGRWREVVPGAGAFLPELASRLARLAELERRFAAVLEKEKLDAVAEFAAGAGHEINNPLAVIGGRAQLYLRDETDPERRRGLALIAAQVKRAYEMIADMRLFARPPQPEPRPFDLAAMLDQLAAELAPAAARQAIQLSRKGHAGPLEIEADPAQVQVAVRAVVQNALEAIGREGHVEIGLHAAEGQVRIRIADDGPGIGPEERRHLFDPFFSARQAGRGLGLGLSKAWRIVVTNHGGQIDVQSEPGRGAAFTITLPRKG